MKNRRYRVGKSAEKRKGTQQRYREKRRRRMDMQFRSLTQADRDETLDL